MKTLDEISVSAIVHRKMLEKDVQKQCVDWVRARGYWARKFSSQSQRSVPDYLFGRVLSRWDDTGEMTRSVGPSTSAVKFATEFKRPGTKPKLIKKYGVTVMSTEAQYEEQLAMQAAGWFTFECDNFEKFKATVTAYEKEQTA